MMHLYFFVDGRERAYRSWPGAPREGDRVMLDQQAFHVGKVEWQDMGIDSAPHIGILLLPVAEQG